LASVAKAPRKARFSGTRRRKFSSPIKKDLKKEINYILPLFETLTPKGFLKK
jgi:hypothetical protein